HGRAVGVKKAREVAPLVQAKSWGHSPQIDGTLVAVSDVTGGIRHVDGRRQCPQQVSKLLFAFLQRFFGMFALRDVSCQALDAQEAPGGVELAGCGFLQPYFLRVRAFESEASGVGGAL